MSNLKNAFQKLYFIAKGKRVVYFCVCAYILYYIRHMRKPRIVMRKDDPIMTQLLLTKLKLDEKRFWPLFIAPGGWSQMVIFLIMMGKSMLSHFIGFRKLLPYKKSVVTTDQGDAVLHWVSPPAGCEEKSIVVIFPPIIGLYTDPIIADTVDMFNASSYEVVIYNRRCPENESLYFSVVGDPNMTEKVLAAIAKERPGRGLFLVGFSAGTGPICRYLQDLAYKRRDNALNVRFASMIFPGYSSDFDAEANIWILNQLTWNMNNFFLNSIHDAKAPETVKRLRSCWGIRKWIEISAELSGYGTIKSYREHCCPGYDWPHLDTLPEAEVSEMKYFPAVVFNARDDILFPWGMVKKYEHYFRKLHSISLLDTEYGSHFSYLDTRAENWAVRMTILIFDQLVINESKLMTEA